MLIALLLVAKPHPSAIYVVFDAKLNRSSAGAQALKQHIWCLFKTSTQAQMCACLACMSHDDRNVGLVKHTPQAHNNPENQAVKKARFARTQQMTLL